MLNKLEKLLKTKGWKYQVLRNNLHQKIALYFILGNEEIILFKHEEGIIEDYINLIEEW